MDYRKQLKEELNELVKKNAATLIRQRRPAERQAVFLPCRSVNCTYYVYEHPHKVFLWEQRRKGDELSADDGDG